MKMTNDFSVEVNNEFLSGNCVPDSQPIPVCVFHCHPYPH